MLARGGSDAGTAPPCGSRSAPVYRGRQCSPGCRRSRAAALAREVLLGAAFHAPGHRVQRDRRRQNVRVVMMGRRTYIDWARGIAVLLMIEAHTTDAWTRMASKATAGFRYETLLGGFAAPAFLWLAG